MTPNSENVEFVLKDADKFKRRAEIGDKAYAWLRRVENLDQYLKAITTGGLAGTSVILMYLMTLGPVSKVLLALGLAGLPWSAAIAVALVAAGGTLGTIKITKKGRKKVIIETPKFVNCPLDILAASVAEILLPPCVLLSDRYKNAQKVLVNEWGYDSNYIARLADEVLQNPEKFSLTSRAKLLHDSRVVMNHVECERLVKEIESLALDAITIREAPQQQLYDAFKRYLCHDKNVTLETVRLLEQLVLGHEVILLAPTQRSGFWTKIFPKKAV